MCKSISSLHWYNDKVPNIVTIMNVDRYRTLHGSHTAAATGACSFTNSIDKGGTCSLRHTDILPYQEDERHNSIPRAHRIFRILVESLEDIYLLSLNDALIAQGSSHFSTLAALLIWARTGCVDVINTVIFLDELEINEGLIPSAMLHGQNLLNSTYGLRNHPNKTEAAILRWNQHQNLFISGLRNTSIDMTIYNNNNNNNNTNGKKKKMTMETIDPWDESSRIHIRSNLPYISPQIFYRETQNWLGLNELYQPVWNGMCPGKFSKGQNATKYVVDVSNLGVEHYEMNHPDQAIQCWRNCLDAINSSVHTSIIKDNLLPFKKVILGNIASMALKDMMEFILEHGINVLNYQYEILQYYILQDDTKILANSVPFDSFIRKNAMMEESKIYQTEFFHPSEMVSSSFSSIDDVDNTIIELEAKVANLEHTRKEVIRLTKLQYQAYENLHH
jgi:hypothetical protein